MADDSLQAQVETALQILQSRLMDQHAAIYDGMTVADAIAVLQQFNPHAPLILQAILPSGEVHGLPLKVFQPHPGAPVGMTMRCHTG
jgi:hypothetical protein